MTDNAAVIDNLIEEIDQRNAVEAGLIDDLRRAWANHSGSETPPTNPEPSPPSGDNLGTPNFIAGADQGAEPEGWLFGTGAWDFNGDGTITVGPANGIRANAIVEPKTALEGKRITFSFRMDSADAATGTFFVDASVQGGGRGSGLVRTNSVEVIPGETASLDLGVIPASNKRLQIIIGREPGSTGTVTLSQLALTED